MCDLEKDLEDAKRETFEHGKDPAHVDSYDMRVILMLGVDLSRMLKWTVRFFLHRGIFFFFP